MHRDIRSFFTVKKAKKKVDDEDSDIIPESPEVKVLNNKKKQSRKRRQIQEDSDEEIFTPPRKKQNEPKSALKEVKVVDLFGSGPIKRSEPLVKKSKKETETGIHSDDEFEKSLLQLDEVDNLVSSSSPFKDNHVARIDSIGKPNDGTIKNHDSKEKYDEGNEKFKNSSNYERYVKKFEIQDGINKKSKKPFQKKEADKVDKDQTISDRKSEPKKHVSKDTFNLKDKESSHKRKLDKVNSDQTTGDSKLEPEKYVSNDTVHMKDKESSLKRKLEKFDRDQKIGDSESKNHDSNDSVHIKVKESSHKRKLEKVYSDQTIVDKKVGPKNHENISKKDKVSSNERKLDKLDNDLQRNDIKSKHENHDSKNYAHTKNDNESTFQKRKLDNINDDVTNIDTKPDKIKKEKQDFNEFLKDDKITIHDDKNGEPKQKKVKLDKSLNDSALTDEERHERKRYSAALYQKFLNRSGPKHLGSKEIPEGLPNCLRDCAFLLTGVLDSFERDEVVAAITKYGGCVKSGISKKVTHVIAGDDAGPAKLAKAEELGIKIINEDEFLKMIKDSNDKHKHTNHKDENVDRKRDKSKEKKTNNHGESNKKETKTEGIKIKDSKSSLTNGTSKKERSVSPKPVVCKDEVKSGIKTPTVNGDTNKSGDLTETASLMWVDKYKPTSVKQIIGQHGDKSNVKKLTNWLTNWYVNRKAKIPKPSPWAKDDNGAYYKAALLSGPPGVGKTTTVSLVCKELGFDMVEFNASDTRSKTLIREQIGELLTTTSLSAYAKGATGKGAVSKKHVLVMDEVDGMAGNEDRGGLQELISLIKSTSVPVICMCNDRSSEKMRSLVNYCYDLRFERPRVNQIMCAMLSVCFKEGVKVPNDVLTQLIEAAGHDVRQTLHMLSVWVADSTLMDHDRLKQEAGRVKKDMKMGPWEAIRRVFSAEEHRSMSISDKSDLFFTDYSIMPLFVQENYLSVVPHGPGKSSLSKLETLERVSRAADSISAGDLVDARIRRHQAWSLLPMQAMYSSVIPGQEMEGHVAGQIQFPGWLGKNSRATKMRRLAQEIHAHTRLSTSGSKSSIFLDYATHLRDAILNPLLQDKTDGIDESLRVLESYNLLREDLDSLVELSMWPEKRNPMVLIDAKVKAALTRTYNKTASALPYAPGAVKKGRGLADDDDENTQDDAGEAEDDSDPEHDAMIKKKKSKETEKAGPSKAAGKGKKTAPPSEPPSKGKKKTTNIKR